MKVQIRIIPLLFLLGLAMLFAWLGNWQLERKTAKQELLDRFDQAAEATLGQALEADYDFAQVRLLGQYEPGWDLLLDNKIWNGQPGVHVLSLFHSQDGFDVLVDRGWLPMSRDRRKLPAVPAMPGERVISGILSKLPSGGVQLGEPDAVDQLAGPVLITYLDIDAIANSTGLDIVPRILKLDEEDESGFEDRQWSPAVILPPQHQAYVVQWFALAIAAIILVFTMGIRFRREQR